tara:strand:+ start:292 stop:471 length:180 start_codon:yes stop_codon:yes gene_type:complete
MAYPTNPIYKLYNSPITGNLEGVKKQDGDVVTCIPINEENTDYQEYLEWAKTNTAEEAD